MEVVAFDLTFYPVLGLCSMKKRAKKMCLKLSPIVSIDSFLSSSFNTLVPAKHSMRRYLAESSSLCYASTNPAIPMELG